MARVSFSPLVEEIIGKLAGSVFQDSYGGLQVRTRVSPRNPQSTFQQLRRGEFGFLSASWRGLSPVDRQTFIDNAASPGAALNLFLQANVNLTLVEEPTITTYVPSTDPGTMQIEFDTAETGSLTVKATGSPQVVPAGTKLLLQVTYQKAPTKIFSNPSQYSPVISFDEGTDLTLPVSILTEWQTRYGVMLPEKRFCLSSALIDKSNGHRGATLINCTTVTEMAKFVKVFTDLTLTTANTGSDTDAFIYSMPGNTLASEGDCLYCNYKGQRTVGGGNASIKWNFAGTDVIPPPYVTANDWDLTVKAIRKGSDTLIVSAILTNTAGVVSEDMLSISAIDFTISNNIKLILRPFTAGTIVGLSAYINKELV